jgi:TonB family protein
VALYGRVPKEERSEVAMKRILHALFLTYFTVVVAGQQPQQSASDPQVGTPSSDKGSASAKTKGNLEVLSDTQGVDFGPYLTDVLAAVRKNWHTLIPAEARKPEMKSGKLTIEFVILPDGKVAGLKLVSPSGDAALDRAAWGGIAASNPFAPCQPNSEGRIWL